MLHASILSGNCLLTSGLVLGTGLEPALPLRESDFKSDASTIPPTERSTQSSFSSQLPSMGLFEVHTLPPADLIQARISSIGPSINIEVPSARISPFLRLTMDSAPYRSRTRCAGTSGIVTSQRIIS